MWWVNSLDLSILCTFHTPQIEPLLWIGNWHNTIVTQWLATHTHDFIIPVAASLWYVRHMKCIRPACMCTTLMSCPHDLWVIYYPGCFIDWNRSHGDSDTVFKISSTSEALLSPSLGLFYNICVQCAYLKVKAVNLN
jgi:hypothetical protein